MPDHGTYPRGVKLGVDVGTVRVGLAACDPDGILASPLRTLSRDAKKNSDVGVIVRQASERGAVQIFVGLPRTLKGQEGPSARMATEYAMLLAEALGRAGLDIPVHLIDERLSTVSAHRNLHEAGLSSKDHRKVVDQLAAAGILQHAIEMQKSRGQDVGRRVSAPAPAEESAQTGGAGAGGSGPATETDSQRAEGNREPGQS
ncbi:Holliday junction resolvase RuvX [Arthrobacter celericrescens]|uniref:Holliday junction resolvase RuvX n=1 Tax=Arthrobacter celericrescens TaxID=2320851 RepID=UPI000EA18121|nr:Holliday junction resolvase RuvX [Arthrobacter celericrescens]